MATITPRVAQDGTISYRVEIRLRGYPRTSATFARKTDARKWISDTESAIRQGRYFNTLEAKKHTLADAIDRYEREVLPTKGKTTQPGQAIHLAWWRKHLGERTLFDVTPSLIAEYRKVLADEPIAFHRRPRKPGTEAKASTAPQAERFRGPSTINAYLITLSHLFTVAIKEWEWLEVNPLTKVTKPKKPRGRVRFLSEDEIGPHGEAIPGERTRLLEACRESDSPDLYPAVILSLATGARQQEILGMTWGQVDFTRRVATLYDTKNKEIRPLPLSGLALELLRERSKVRRLDTDLIFPGRFKPRQPGQRLDEAPPRRPVNLRSSFEAALKRAGIEDFHWHDLRHSTASYLAMNGASLAEIAEVLGHKTLAMVKRYAHLSEQHTARVVESMNKRIFG